MLSPTPSIIIIYILPFLPFNSSSHSLSPASSLHIIIMLKTPPPLYNLLPFNRNDIYSTSQSSSRHLNMLSPSRVRYPDLIILPLLVVLLLCAVKSGISCFDALKSLFCAVLVATIPLSMQSFCRTFNTIRKRSRPTKNGRSMLSTFFCLPLASSPSQYLVHLVLFNMFGGGHFRMKLVGISLMSPCVGSAAQSASIHDAIFQR